MFTLLIILYVIVCVFLILVVLLQQGKGADVAAAFGGASTQASFGPRGTSTLMHKLTTASFVLFVVLCIGLAVMSARKGRSVASGLKSAPPASAPASQPPAQQAPAEQQPAPAQQAPETK